MNSIRALSLAGCLAVLAASVFRFGGIAMSGATEPSQPAVATPLEIAALPNAYRLHENVISGGQPEGESGFQALQKLGVRTVISVDGAQPEVSLAKKYGLRYVHLPHGYDGIPEQRVLELAKAVTDLPGPIYIHCHHGKHRSPAAAAVACISAGLITREAGREVLEVAGTSSDYQGLYRSVATAEQRQELKDLQVEFRESVELPPLANAMVLIEKSFDNLKQIGKSNWETPATHPDLTPAHEALLLREQFSELLRTEEVLRRPLEFRELLERSRAAAESLEKNLREGGATRPVTATAKRRLSAALGSIGNDCIRCHRAHRD
ncbi:MAG: hypothetical protein ABI614_01205 [Planctomycetota bacterium]